MEPSPITIAVLNDDQLYRHLVGQLLAEEGYRIVESTTGTQAYPIVREARPALVVLDIRVGSLEGAWLTLELLRLDPATARIPVILCSANTLLARDSVMRLHQLGCTMIEKPMCVRRSTRETARGCASRSSAEQAGSALARRRRCSG